MEIIYLQNYYDTKIASYVDTLSLNGIEKDFKKLALIENFINLPDLLNQGTPIFLASGNGVYYTQPYEIIDFEYTVYAEDWYCFYIKGFTEKINQNALIVDENGYVIAVLIQKEDWSEDYSFRTLFIDTLIGNENFVTRVSTLKTDENFEENLLCLDLRSFTERNPVNDYLYTKYVKFEEDEDWTYIRSIIKEHGYYYTLVKITNDYLCLNFTPQQKIEYVNVLQKVCIVP